MQLNIKQKNTIETMLSSKIIFNEPLMNHTSFGIGGPASCLIYPNNREELSQVLQYAKKENISVFFIGSGSNILVWDRGFNGIVISLRKTFKNLTIKANHQIIVESGVMLGNLVKKAIHSNIKGLESLIGVPGTLGGALIMNAGAFGNEISNYFTEAQTMTIEGEIKKYNKNQINFSYRDSTFPKNEILIEATFNCTEGVPSEIQKDKQNASLSRKTKQPLKFRSAGSIFKNPSNTVAAGYLIDKTGLKGIRKGGACISTKHANFILNIDKALAKDVFDLICLAKQKVLEKFNINLELEIKLLGFPQSMLKVICYD